MPWEVRARTKPLLIFRVWWNMAPARDLLSPSILIPLSNAGSSNYASSLEE